MRTGSLLRTFSPSTAEWVELNIIAPLSLLSPAIPINVGPPDESIRLITSATDYGYSAEVLGAEGEEARDIDGDTLGDFVDDYYDGDADGAGTGSGHGSGSSTRNGGEDIWSTSRPGSIARLRSTSVLFDSRSTEMGSSSKGFSIRAKGRVGKPTGSRWHWLAGDLGWFWKETVAPEMPEKGDVRDYLALERTFLAHFHTSLALAETSVLISQYWTLSANSIPTGVLGAQYVGNPLACAFAAWAFLVVVVGAKRFFVAQGALLRGKAIVGGLDLLGEGLGIGIIIVVALIITLSET